MKTLLISCLGVLLSLSAMAQPRLMGCHQLKSKYPKPRKLTDAERAMMQASILRSDTFDILNYDIVIDVTDELNQAITATTTITYTPKFNDLETILLDLFELEVDSVKDENGLLNYNYDDEILQVYFDNPGTTEDTLDLVVYYHGEPHQDPYWGGFYFELGYIYNLGIGLTTIPPNFGKVWYPCFDTFLERATYAYHVKSANGKIAMCQGTFMGEDALEGDTVVRHFELNQRIPTYLSAIAVAEYESVEYVHEGLNGDVPVMLTTRPSLIPGMETAFSELGWAIDALEYWYGPYIWERVGYVHTTDGALEIPTNIAYPSFMNGASLFDNGQLLAHELGHHWWGDVIAPYIHNHMWIKEGFAEYGGHLFVEYKDGFEAFVDVVKDNMLFVLEEAHIQDDGFHVLSPIPDEQIYGRHTYYKGAAVVHNLRGYLGDEVFKDLMHTIQADYQFTSLTATELKEAMEGITGVDLDPYFDAWIFAPGFAVLVPEEVNIESSGDGYETTIDVRQLLREAPEYHLDVPIDVTLVDENWQKEHIQVMASGETTTVSVESDFEPMMVHLNGQNRLNQARMDHEVVIQPDDDFNQQLPFVDFRIKMNSLSDSAFIRVEHMWAGPFAENYGEGIAQIAENHYWSVRGMFPEEYDLEARMTYKGIVETDLDFDLVNETEEGLIVVYREQGSDSWEVYPDFTLVAGNPLSGSGSMVIDVLIPGEYALAKAGESINVDDQASVDLSVMNIYPNPTSSNINIGVTSNTEHNTAMLRIFNDVGQVVMERQVKLEMGEALMTLDVYGWSHGYYIGGLYDQDGQQLDVVTFEVVR